jgi:hypothetical protein
MTPQRKRISFLFGLCWVIGFFAFSSPTPSNGYKHGWAEIQTFLNQDQAPEIDIRVNFDIPNIPPFKVDGSLIHRLNTPWISDQLNYNFPYLAPSFFQKSISCFNVRDTFFHFFFSW